MSVHRGRVLAFALSIITLISITRGANGQADQPVMLVLARDSSISFGEPARRAQYGKLYVVSHAGLNKAQVVTEGTYIAETMELPWRNNLGDLSSIPEGTFRGTASQNVKLGWVIVLKGTGPREGIIIHRGNYPIDTHGCILLGLGRSEREQPLQVPSPDDADKQVRDSHSGAGPVVPVVTDSGLAMAKLKSVLVEGHTENVMLTIMN
jgi:Family of unknown function (DUF5675)